MSGRFRQPAIRILFVLFGLLLACLGFAPATQADEQKIGLVYYPAFEGAQGLRGETPPRDLLPQTQIFSNEIVRTPTTGSTQLQFLDQSTLRIGPGSEVVLDSFVFDPASAGGSAALMLTTGIMRFISGAMETEENISLQTPHATITIRGTDVVARTEGLGTRVTVVSGSVKVCSTITGECIIAHECQTIFIEAASGDYERYEDISAVEEAGMENPFTLSLEIGPTGCSDNHGIGSIDVIIPCPSCDVSPS